MVGFTGMLKTKNGASIELTTRSKTMSLWNNHKKHPPVDLNDDEEDMPLDFEKQVIDEFAKLTKAFKKLEEAQNERIARLEAELQRSREYVEMLLAKLLDKDYVVSAISKHTTSTSKIPIAKDNGAERKLATPVGRLP